MVSILFPIAYLVALVGSLSIFSKILRKRQQNKPAAEPWFPQHKSRDIYVSLLSLDPPPARPILVAALLRRAMDDVKLIWSIRDAKASLTTLLQRGQIGDDLWERFLQAEKELEGEIVEVVGEANTFEPGYGQRIFAMASEMVSHERWKEVYQNIQLRRDQENAKLAADAPQSLVLAPTPYLTPASLTLAPSNPLPLAGTTSARSAILEPLPNDLAAPPESQSRDASTSPSPSPSKPSPAVAAAAAAGTNPSRPQTPLKGSQSSPSSRPPRATTNDDDDDGGSNQNRFEELEDRDDGHGDLAPPIPASPPSTTPVTGATPATTPKKTPNKKGKKKPAVKGGR